MSKKQDPHSKQAKQEKKAKQQKRNSELLDLLRSLASIRDDLELASEDFQEDWQPQRLSRLDADARDHAKEVLESLVHTLADVNYALDTLVEDAPEQVRQTFAEEEAFEESLDSEDEPASPEGALEAQSRMRDSLMAVATSSRPVEAARDAACAAAETMFIAGKGMADRTRAAALEVVEGFPDIPATKLLRQVLTEQAESAHFFATDLIEAFYKDTCMEAKELCKAIVDGTDSIRGGASLQ